MSGILKIRRDHHPPSPRRGFALLILTRFEFLWTSRGPKPAKTGRFTLTTRHTTRFSPRNTETAAANFSDNFCRPRFILAIIYSFHLYSPSNFRVVQSFDSFDWKRTSDRRSIDWCENNSRTSAIHNILKIISMRISITYVLFFNSSSNFESKSLVRVTRCP